MEEELEIVIHVSGGNVQNVWCSRGNVRVVMVDYDNIEAGDPHPYEDHDGLKAHVEDAELVHVY